MHIDWWTLALQTVNIVVLVWILSRFLYRPMRDVLARRQAEMMQELDQAKAARTAAEAERRAAAAERRSLLEERSSVLDAAERKARAEADAVKEQTREEIGKEHANAAARLAQMEIAARKSLIVEAGKVAVEIARRLLGRLPADMQFQAFLEGLCGEVQRDRAKSTDGGAMSGSESFEIATAAPLSELQIQQTRKALREALGAEPQLQFRVEPQLIAGLELRGAHMKASNSWASDLNRIQVELMDAGSGA